MVWQLRREEYKGIIEDWLDQESRITVSPAGLDSVGWNNFFDRIDNNNLYPYPLARINPNFSVHLTDSNYNLVLDDYGLRKVFISTIVDPNNPEEITYVERIGVNADFQDFIKLGSFMKDELFKIPKEITKGVEHYGTGDLPLDAMRNDKFVLPKHSKLLNWDYIGECIRVRFFWLFKNAGQERIWTPIAKKGFQPSQVREVIGLAQKMLEYN